MAQNNPFQSLGNFLGGIGNAVSGAAQNAGHWFDSQVSNTNNWLGGASQPVQRFAGQAQQSLEQLPKEVGNYFNPQASGQGGFWSQQNPLATGLANAQMGSQIIAQNPVDVFGMGQWGKNTQQAIGNNPAGQAGGFLAGLPGGIVNGVVNVPQELAKSGIDIGNDLMDMKSMTWQKSIGDLAEAALPILTIATFGEGGAVKSAAERLGSGGISEAIKAGSLNTLLGGVGKGAIVGGQFGVLGGLESGKNINDLGQYGQNLALNTGEGILGGGIVGGTLSIPRALKVRGIAGQTKTLPTPENVTQLGQPQVTAQNFITRGSDLLTPEGQQGLINATQQATQSQPALHSVLDAVAQETKGQAYSGVKNPESAATKIVEKRTGGEANYGINDVNDNLRGSVVVPDRSHVANAVSSLETKLKAQGYTVNKVEDFFKSPSKNNYQGVHIDVTDANGQKSEIQVHTNESFAQSQLTHDFYSTFNEDIPKEIKPQLKAIQDYISKANSDQQDVAGRINMKQAADSGKMLNTQHSDHSQGGYSNEALARQRLINHQYETGTAGLSDKTAPLNAVRDSTIGNDQGLSDKELMLKQLKQANPNADYSSLEQEVAQDKASQQPAPPTHYLDNLIRMRDNLQNQSGTNVSVKSDEVDHLNSMKIGFQQEIDAAKQFSRTRVRDQYQASQQGVKVAQPKDVQSHIKALQQNIKLIDSRLNNIQKSSDQGNKTNQDQIKMKISDLNDQISKEQTRLGIKSQAVGKPAPVGSPAERRAQAVAAAPEEVKTAATTQANQQYAPANGFRSGIQSAVNQMDSTLNRENLGTNRDLANKVEGELGAGETNGNLVAKDFKDLNPKESENVFRALQNEVDPNTLSAKEKDAFDQAQGFLKKGEDVRGARDKNFKPITTGYAPIYVDRTADVKDVGVKQALSTYSPENLQRQVRRYMPVDGQGDALVGQAGAFGSAKGLKPTGTTFEDAQGRQYTATNATARDYESLGLKVDTDLGSVLNKYTQSTSKLKVNQDVVDSLRSGQYADQISSVKKGGNWIDGGSIDPSLKGMYVEGKLGNALKALQGREKGSAYNRYITTPIRNTIFYNALLHPVNMYVNALIGSGRAGAGGFLDLHKNIMSSVGDVLSKNEDYAAAQRQGIGLGGFKNSGKPGLFESILNKVTGDNQYASKLGAGMDTINPIRQTYKLNQWATGFSDDVLRTALNKTFQNSGMDEVGARNATQHFLIDYGNVNSGLEKNIANNVLIFYPWLKGNLGILGSAAAHPLQNSGPILTGAILYGTLSAAQQYAQQWTGNQDARLRFPGVLGIARDVTEAPGQTWNNGQLALGRPGIPGIVGGHLSPVVREGVQQATNSNFLPTSFGLNRTPMVKDNLTPDQAMQQRLTHAATNLYAPAEPGTAIALGKKTPAETFVNKFLPISLSTPHLKGYSAMPNQPDASIPGLGNINAPGAKPTTGEQIYKAQDQGQSQFNAKDWTDFQSLQNIKKSGGSAAQISQAETKAYQANPKMWDYTAQQAKASASAAGIPVNPIYKYNSQDMKTYWGYQSQSSSQTRDSYAYQHPEVIQKLREIDAYKSNPQVEKYETEQAKSAGWSVPEPYTANPMYQRYNNSQIGDYYQLNSLYNNKPQYTAWAANHPWVKDMEVYNQVYQLQKLQTSWDARPNGQSFQDFYKANSQTYADGSSSTPNIAGINPDTGKLIPKLDPMQNPWLQLNQNQKQIALAYTAERTGNGATDAKTKGLISQNPWLPAYWSAENSYYAGANGLSTTSSDSTGLGMTFSTAGAKGGSGGGGSSYTPYSSSYNPNSSMENYIKKQMIYSAIDRLIATGPSSLTNGLVPLKSATIYNPKQAAASVAIKMPKGPNLQQVAPSTTPYPRISMPQRQAIGLRNQIPSKGGFLR